jgi:hypothetical protein
MRRASDRSSVALLSSAHWEAAKRRLPDASEVDARVRPRYADLLARIAAGLDLAKAIEPQAAAADAAEALLPFLPPDPANFVTLENAAITVGFGGPHVERALLLLFERRLQSGDAAGASAILRELGRHLPAAAELEGQRR